MITIKTNDVLSVKIGDEMVPLSAIIGTKTTNEEETKAWVNEVLSANDFRIATDEEVENALDNA